MKITKEQLSELIPGNTEVDAWYDALVDVLPKYDISTERRIAHFISQCAHESNNFRSLEENLNYSEKSLKAVFGRYFGAAPKRDAKEYARKPEKIANYVYQDEFRSARGKMGNVNPGDGWLFRGRGLKQLTGRNNYTGFGKSIGMSAEQAAAYVATPKGAVESACWFWNTNNLNAIADTDDVVKMTKKINGGDIGLADRQARYNRAIEVLTGKAVAKKKTSSGAKKSSPTTTLKMGSKGDDVKAMQTALGTDADGVFGLGTKRAVKEFQTANGLTADGIAGPATLSKLFR